MPYVAVLLAAGAGTRFHGATHKLLAPLGQSTVFEVALDAVLEAGFDQVVVVGGATPVPMPEPAPARPELTLAHNPRWAEGQATSLQVALAAADRLGATTVTVGLGDQPFVGAESWRRVRDAPDTCRIVVAEYDGAVGPNPVRLDRSVWPLLPHHGDHGARAVIREHAEWVCRVACLGSVADIDTLEDLERWRSC